MNDISNDSTTTTSKETSRINRNDENNNNANNEKSSSIVTSTTHTISATYGPDHGRRLCNGEWSNTEYDRVPHTRDALPFLRTMTLHNKQNNSNNDDANSMEEQNEMEMKALM